MIDYKILNNIAIIQLIDKKNKNIFSYKLWRQLDESLGMAVRDQNVKLVVLTGYEKVFSLGMPLKVASNFSLQQVSKAIDLLQKVNLTIYSSRKIFLAGINGFAMGPGFELAIACDLILASDKAWMSLPQASRCMVTDAGGLSMLKLKGINEFFINEILMTGKKYESMELKNRGIINEILENQNFLTQTQRYAENLLSNDLRAIETYKQEQRNPGQIQKLKKMLKIEKQNQLRLIKNLIQKKCYVVDHALKETF